MNQCQTACGAPNQLDGNARIVTGAIVQNDATIKILAIVQIAPSVFYVPRRRDVIFMGSGTVILNEAGSLYRNYYVNLVNRNTDISYFHMALRVGTESFNPSGDYGAPNFGKVNNCITIPYEALSKQAIWQICQILANELIHCQGPNKHDQANSLSPDQNDLTSNHCSSSNSQEDCLNVQTLKNIQKYNWNSHVEVEPWYIPPNIPKDVPPKVKNNKTDLRKSVDDHKRLSAGPYVTKKGNGSIYLAKAILLFKSTHQGLI